MHIEKILKALANRRRLTIIKLVRDSELSVTDIAQKIRLSVKATSKHLQILFVAGLLDRRQKSLIVYYRLPEALHPFVVTFFTIL